MTRTRMRHRCIGVLLAGLGVAIGFAGAAVPDFALIGSARAQERAGDTVRPEIGKPIQAAVDLLKSKRGKDALARVHEADTVPNKTAYEAYLVERVRGQAAAAAGDASTAARAFEATAASSAVSGAAARSEN